MALYFKTKEAQVLGNQTTIIMSAFIFHKKVTSFFDR